MGHHQQEERVFGDQNRKENHSYHVGQEYWVIKEDREDICDSRSVESSSQENSVISMESSSSSDLAEDASSSSSTSSSSSSSNGPLYELSELMIHLPMRRGLSKHYQGKSQSFTSLAAVESLEDLAKKVVPYYRKKMKPCRSGYGGRLDGHRPYTTTPKPVISKKAASRGTFLYSSSKRGKLLG